MNAKQAQSHGQATPLPRRRLFTLVEMMVVLVIAAIVMAIAIPSFVKMTAGSSVRTGTRLLAAQIRLTRQYAISQRRTVALVIPGNEVTGVTDELCYVAMKPAIVEPTATANQFTFVEWVEGSKWLHVPRGAVIAEADDDIGIADASGFLPAPQDDTFSVVVGLAPDDPELADLCEGLTNSTAVELRALVFSPTGRVLGTGGSAANVTIAQMTYTGGNWINRAPGGAVGSSAEASTNQFNIEINPFTGRIKISSPPEY
jgi:prepilin-type N-terminal cleavage/methylation domain-containing protein